MASSGNSDTGSGGFSSGADGALYGDPSNPGSATDYNTWDWHQIEAAIDGGSMMPSGSDDARAKSVSDPTTLWNAASTFYSVQTALAMIGQNMADQAKALAGTDGPWKGDAADAFMQAMTTYSNGVIANANVLASGALSKSIPDQLTDNGNVLSWAQDQIESIDQYYAGVAVKPPYNVQTIGGLVQIHEAPTLVTMMTQQMLGVLTTVASEYTDTINNVKSPNATGNPPPNTNIPTPNLNDPPPLGPPPNLNAVPPPANLTGRRPRRT